MKILLEGFKTRHEEEENSIYKLKGGQWKIASLSNMDQMKEKYSEPKGSVGHEATEQLLIMKVPGEERKGKRGCLKK